MGRSTTGGLVPDAKRGGWPVPSVAALVVCAAVGHWPGAHAQSPGQGLAEHAGKHSATAAVGQKGARFTLANGWSLLLPAGLPIGDSRLLTLKVARRRAKGKEVAAGFVPIGPTVNFDGAINATDAPLLALYRAKRFRPRKRHRLVLASEYGGFCDGERPGRKLPGGLCAAWRLLDAELDREAGVVRARVELPGGHRLQFGSVPLEKDNAEG